jgi:gamma-glutamylcyclotransferase (GGCT)/AIG2-like uncharacterized protein YtfP
MREEEFSNKSVNEVRFSPKTFAQAISTGQEKGVLVGYEFEVCIPEKTLDKIPKESLRDDYYDNLVKDYFSSDTGFYELYVYDNGDGDGVIPINKMDKLFIIKQDKKPKYPTFKDAYKSLSKDKREDENLNYEDLLKIIFPRTPSTTIESSLFEYFTIDSKKIYKFWEDEFGIDLEEDYANNYDENEYYLAADKLLKSELKKTFNADVIVFSYYHQEKKNKTSWYIEPDSSIEPDTSQDVGLEIVTPPIPANEAMDVLKKFYAMAKKLKFYTGHEFGTGLHINVSIPENIDLLKLILFSGDTHILKQFDREGSEYAKNVYNAMTKKIAEPNVSKATFPTTTTTRGKSKFVAGIPKTKTKINLEDILKIAKNYTRYHYVSISNYPRARYVSFRHVGGDYLKSYEDVVNVVGRFVQLLIIASDPKLYRNEYLKKLSKLIARPKPYHVPDLVSSNIIPIYNEIKAKGLPVMIVDMAFPIYTAKSISKSSAVHKALAYRDGYLSHHDMSYNSEHSVMMNSPNAKQNIFSKINNKLKATLNRANTTYSTIIFYPRSKDLRSLRFLLDRKIPSPLKGMDEFEDAVCYWKYERLPITNELTQKFVSDLVKVNVKRNIRTNESLEYPEQPVYYFSYGMLCNPDFMPGAELVGVGELKNFEYKMYQYANVEPKKDSNVYGCLWKIDRQMIRQLDRIEGYPNLYDRRTYPVYLDGKKYETEVYIMIPETIQYLKNTVPVRRYVRNIMHGYKNAGVPISQLTNALSHIKSRTVK